MAKKINFDNRSNAYLMIVVFSIIFVTASILIQLSSGDFTKINCSYIDPINIDIGAIVGSIFLIIEGISRIHVNKKDKLKIHLLRVLRVSFGFSILILHIFQFSYK